MIAADSSTLNDHRHWLLHRTAPRQGKTSYRFVDSNVNNSYSWLRLKVLSTAIGPQNTNT
jgi:hypothetical protein